MNKWIRNLCGGIAALLIWMAIGQSAMVAASEISVRTAVIVALQGEAKVQPAGSSLQYDAFEGMTLQQGDRIIVGQGGAQLRIKDTGDEVNLGEYSVLDISRLAGGPQGKTTKLTMLSGMAYFAVTDLHGKPDTFQVVNGNHTLDVKGTHFLVVTDPVTGASSLSVVAGAVSTGSSRPASGGSLNQQPPIVIYPAQQIYLGGSEPGGPSVVDPTRLIQNTPPGVIESLLKNAEKIQKENEQTKKSLEEQANTPKQPADANLPQQLADLNKISQNLSNLVGNLAQEAVKQQKLSSVQVQQLIDEANRSLEGNGKIDLDKVQPLDKTAGVDPELAKREQLLKEKQEELNRLQLELQNEHQALIQRILEQQAKLQEENRKAQEEARARAQEQFTNQLPPQDREQFLADKRKLEQEKIQRGGSTPPSPAPVVPTAPSGGTSAPSNPNPNPNPNPEPPASFTLNWRYADETSVPLGVQHTLAFGLTLKEGVEPKSDKLKVKVTLSSNVPEAVYAAIGYDFEYDSLPPTELNLEACGTSTAASCGEAWLPSEEDAGYGIGAIDDGWPAVISANWGQIGNYTVTAEAFQSEGDTLVSLGKQSFQFKVSEKPTIGFTGGESSVNLAPEEQLTYAFSAKGENIQPSYRLALKATIYGEAPYADVPVTLYHNGAPVASGIVDGNGTAYLTGEAGVLAALLATGSDLTLAWEPFAAETGTYEIGLSWVYPPADGLDPYPFSEDKNVQLNVGTL
ncbi:hypothetical protein GNP92_10050 [Paenibacillus timonensis]|nr:FecR family protein [Paenibacillus timonensis]MUG86684.1 hypothetical protein [Paenibacillus timonensis]